MVVCAIIADTAQIASSLPEGRGHAAQPRAGLRVEMRRERFALAEQKAARAPSVMIFPLAVFILPAVFLVIFVPVILQFLSTQSR